MTSTGPVQAGAGEPEDQAPHCYRHPGRPTYISCTRCGRPICADCMHPASVGFQCPEEVKETRRTVRSARTQFGGLVPSGRDVTSVLVGINIVVFLIMTVSGTHFLDGSQTSELFARFALVPGRVAVVQGDHVTVLKGVAHGDVYRLVTSMFLHFGLIHIALNMFVLLQVGPVVERALGRLRFVTLYLVAGIGGSVASFAFGPTVELGAGASGAIFGLFGAYFVIARRLNAQTGPIVGTIALNLVISVAIPNIDIRAHLGGLIVGAATAAAFAYAPRARRDLWQGAGVAAVLVVVAAVGLLRAPAVRDRENNQPIPAIRVSSLQAPSGLRSPVPPAPAPAAR